MTVIHNLARWRWRRICDVLIACVVIFAFLPLMTAIALAIKAEGGNPVLRRRTRICRNGRWIQALEFRIAAHRNCGMIWMHQFLRRTRVDTLPQVINVLRGDLTFIGIDRPAFMI